MEQNSPAVGAPVEPSVRPSTLAAFLEALNGRRGDLDAWLECNNEAEVRAHVLALVKAEREKCAQACEDEANRWRGTQDVTDFRLCAALCRSGA